MNLQILLWAGQNTTTAKVSASPLSTSNGQKISSKYVKLDFLKFIKMNSRDGYARDPSKVEEVPDMLNGRQPCRIEAGRLQPLWLAVNIPRSAKPGKYFGKVLVKMDNKKLMFNYSIDVLRATVPKVKDWGFDVNLWTHPQAAAHYYSACECKGQDASKYKHHDCQKLMWSKKHLALYRPTLELLRDAGLKTITVNLIKDPWRSSYKLKREQPQTNYSYDEMIRWKRGAKGKFTFDFRNFERYVKFCTKLGINRHIECFSMLPWIKSRYSAVTCYDEVTKKETIHHFKNWEEYDQVWSQFMKSFVPVLVKNGWFEKTRIGVDERGLKNIPHVLKILNKFKHKGKALGLSAAANRTHSFDDQLNLISMHGGTRAIVHEKWTDDQFANWAAARRKKGLSSTWYTCTGTYPGNFGNSRPAESLFIGWYSARIGADGYLRWAVDSWNDNPTETTDHKLYETGDTFQVYPGDREAKRPGARSSVRFELFRQGLVDYEKIQLLKKEHPEAAEEIKAMLSKITRPTMPERIKGNSSLHYEKSSENDFSTMLKVAQKELLEITKKYYR